MTELPVGAGVGEGVGVGDETGVEGGVDGTVTGGTETVLCCDLGQRWSFQLLRAIGRLQKVKDFFLVFCQKSK